MAKRTGTVNDDNLTGTNNDDIFNAFQGGNDTLTGNGGNDFFRLGANFAAGDLVLGGTGIDTLYLDGDYISPLSIDSTMLNSVERIGLAAGHNYNLAILDGVIASGDTLTVNASSLGAGETALIDASSMTAASSNATIVVKGGAGSTKVYDGPGATIVDGGTGQEGVYAGTNFNTSDSFDGGGSGDGDFINLSGDLSAGLTISGAMLRNFEFLNVGAGFDYKLTLNDGVVATGQQLQVNAGSLDSSHSLFFDGSDESDGSFYIYDGAGSDTLMGSANNDYLQGANGGVDKLYGLGGNDVVQMGDRMTAADRIDGGDGNDQLYFVGDYSGGVVLKNATVKNVESFYLNPGSKFKLTTADGTVAAGQTLVVTGGNLGSNDWLKFDGSLETDGSFDVGGGEGNDILKGGAGADIIAGSLQSDVLTGGGGGDSFKYFSLFDSQGAGHDTITDFDAAADQFSFVGVFAAPTAVDAAVTSATLNAATLLADLETALHKPVLRANHAVVITASSGDLAGHTYLVVDGNATGGYQAATDFLIDITGATNLASFDIDNFI